MLDPVRVIISLSMMNSCSVLSRIVESKAELENATTVSPSSGNEMAYSSSQPDLQQQYEYGKQQHSIEWWLPHVPDIRQNYAVCNYSSPGRIAIIDPSFCLVTFELI